MEKLAKADIVHSLVGLRVLRMRDGTNRTEWNGLIVGHKNNLVFIMLYDWLCGSPTHMICIKEEELTVNGRYKFFYDLEYLEGYMEAYQKYNDKAYDEQQKIKEQ